MNQQPDAPNAGAQANQANQPPTYDQLREAYQHTQQQLALVRQQLSNRNPPKPAKPSTFNGSPRANPDTWLFEMETYFTVTSTTQDPFRVQFAVAFLRETASIWWCSVMREPNVPNQWEAFKAQFLDRFRPVEAARTARVALLSLKQHGSVADYTNAFLRQLNLIPDMAQADQIQTYLQGLQPHIWTEVDFKNPTTLNEAMNYAQRADLRRASRRRVFPAFSSRPSLDARPTWHASRPTAAQQSVPMELGHVSAYDQGEGYDSYEEQGTVESQAEAGGAAQGSQLHAFASRPAARPSAATPAKLSPEERERCMRGRLCFRCRRPGHSSRNCTAYGNSAGPAQSGKGRGL